MNRLEFLKIMGTGTTLACVGCLNACSTSNSPDPAPTNIDFTIDISLAENSALQSPGGSLTKNGVIIVRLSSTDFTALWRTCTHQGTPVNYEVGQQDFLCPAHSSRFNVNGGVINGPASSPLRKYNTTLTGSSLRVFS